MVFDIALAERILNDERLLKKLPYLRPLFGASSVKSCCGGGQRKTLKHGVLRALKNKLSVAPQQDVDMLKQVLGVKTLELYLLDREVVR